MTDETNIPPAAEVPFKKKGGWPKGKPRKIYSSRVAAQAQKEGIEVIMGENHKLLPPKAEGVEAGTAAPTPPPRQPESVAMARQQPQAPVSPPQPKDAASKYKMKNALDWDGEFEPDDQSGTDQLRIPKNEFPPGMDLKWVTETVYGQPFPQRLADAQRSGWSVVDSGDFDNKYRGRFASADADGPVRKDGLVLVARPMYISDKFRKKQEQDAINQVRIKEQAWKSGDLKGVTLDSGHQTAVNSNKIVRSVERLEIPRDD